MIQAIFAILAAICKPLSQLWLDHIARNKTPEEKLADAHEATSKAIIQDDAESLNRSVDDRLREIQSRQPGQTHAPNESGAKPDA